MSSQLALRTLRAAGFLVAGALRAALDTAGFLATAFLTAGFLAAGALRTVLATAGFLATAFLTAGFLAAGALRAVLATAGFLATAFLTAGFLVAGALRTVLATAGFLATAFLTAGFLAAGALRAVLATTGFLAVVVLDTDFFTTVDFVAPRFAGAFAAGLAGLFFAVALVAGEGLRVAVALAFPADDFFPAVPAVFNVDVLRVTDFRCVFVFMEHASFF